MNWNIENTYSSEGDNHSIFLTKIKIKEGKQSGNNTDAVLNVIADLKSENAKIIHFDLKAMFLGIVLIMQ